MLKDEGRRLAAPRFKGWDLSDRRISDVHLDVVREEAGRVLSDENPLERHDRTVKRCGLRDVSASPGINFLLRSAYIGHLNKK